MGCVCVCVGGGGGCSWRYAVTATSNSLDHYDGSFASPFSLFHSLYRPVAGWSINQNRNQWNSRVSVSHQSYQRQRCVSVSVTADTDIHLLSL